MSTNTHLFAESITDLQTKQTKTVEELFLGSGYDTIGSFIDESIQTGVEDTPKTVVFGSGGTTVDGSATIDVNGVVSVNKDGYYSVKQRFRTGRTGGAGASNIFFWAEISVDDGNNWSLLGNSVDIALETANDTTVFFDMATIFLPAGVKLRSRFARSSTGHDSGDLRPSIPSAALIAAGVPTAPSAQITIYKI